MSVVQFWQDLKFWQDVRIARRKARTPYDWWKRREALKRLAAYVPDEERLLVLVGKYFREARSVLWMTANMHLMAKHPDFNIRRLARWIVCDVSRIQKFLEDRRCRRSLGTGIYLGVSEALGVGFFEQDELATKELNFIAGVGRSAAIVRQEIDPTWSLAEGERLPILSFQAGLIGHELLLHPYWKRLVAINWQDASEVSEILGKSRRVKRSLREIIKAANRKIADVPLLADAVGSIRLGHCLGGGYLAEMHPFLPAILICRELLWRSAMDMNIPIIGVFDPLSQTMDWEDPDDDHGAGVAA